LEEIERDQEHGVDRVIAGRKKAEVHRAIMKKVAIDDQDHMNVSTTNRAQKVLRIGEIRAMREDTKDTRVKKRKYTKNLAQNRQRQIIDAKRVREDAIDREVKSPKEKSMYIKAWKSRGQRKCTRPVKIF
jgi:hypothetical protein